MLLNERAFNLFTALISFIMIVVSVLLTQSMIQTERQTNDIIAGIESRSELQAVADMTRADAIQIFNFGLRERIEDWLADRDRGRYTIEMADRTWKEIQQDYAAAKFGGDRSIEFADFAANSLIALFYSEAHYGNYSVSLENAQSLREVLDKAIKKSVQTGEFFEVVECDMDKHNNDPRQCRKGTFYVTLAIAGLPFEDYEKLPRLKIRNKATGDEIKEVILPRANFRIFVPVRLFKALAEARAISHRPGAKPNSEQDNGLFSVRLHNQIEQMALGVCDKGFCAPRTNPFIPPQSKSLVRKPCPGAITARTPQVTTVDCSSNSAFCQPTSYDASKKEELTTKLAGMVRAGVCARATQLQSEFLGKENDFGLAQAGDCGGMRIDVQADAEISAAITETLDLVARETLDFPQSYDAESCSRGNPGERVGLYRGADGKTLSPAFSAVSGLCSGTAQGDSGNSHCAEVTRVTATLLFEEKNPIYKVNSKRRLFFEIKLLDNKYTGFAPRFKDGASLSACYFSSAPQQQECSYASGQGWYCASTKVTQDFVPDVADGCVPA